MGRVYSRNGDEGTTGLLYGGRVSKGAELVDALGDIDEAVAALGVARAGCSDGAEPISCCDCNASSSSSPPISPSILGTGIA